MPVDPATGTVRDEFATPGAPFGIAVAADAFRVVIGVGDDDDDRYIHRFVPGRGFESDRIACPDLSGVHVVFDGDTLYLSQAHNKKILALDDHGAILREIDLERRPVGMTVSGGMFYLVTVDDDWKNPQLTAMHAGGKTPRLRGLAPIPFSARGLAFDGRYFWTSHRAVNEIVAFAASVPT